MYKQFLSYIEGNSFLHKLDPRTKIITLMILSIIIFNVGRIWSLLSIFLLFIAVALIARVSLKKLVLSVKPMLFFIGIVFLLHFIFAPAPVFSDVSLSVKMMDNQLNQFDERFFVMAEKDPVTNDVYYLRYYDITTGPAPNQPPAEFRELAGSTQLVLIEPPPDDEFSHEGDWRDKDAHFVVGQMTIRKVPYDQIPEEKLHTFSVAVEEFETIQLEEGRRIHLDEPHIYQISVSPDASFSVYPSTYSLMTGFGVALKFILLILFASLLAATTKQSALVNGLERLVRPIPLKWAKMTSHDLALMVFLMIRFIPLLLSTSSQIRVSLKSRAFEPIKHPFRMIHIISTGLIHSIIDFADDVSRAMINRGYTGVGRTTMNDLKFKKKDGVFFVSFLFVMFAIIMVVGWLQLTIVTPI